MSPGSIFRINFWPAWPAAHGHPVIVWEQYDDGMLLLLPCSHQERYLAKGLCLTDSNCPSAFKVGSPFAIDGKRSFLHFRELEYITSDMPRVKTCDSGLGAFIDQALQTIHFPEWGKTVGYTLKIELSAPDFTALHRRELALMNCAQRWI